MFSRRPVDRLSRIETVCPLAISDSARCDPMNPAPPVMSARTVNASLKWNSESPHERYAGTKASEAAALESLVDRAAGVDLQKPGRVDAERRFTADGAAELE